MHIEFFHTHNTLLNLKLSITIFGFTRLLVINCADITVAYNTSNTIQRSVIISHYTHCSVLNSIIFLTNQTSYCSSMISDSRLDNYII